MPADRETYTGLIPPEKMASEQRCLSEAVYFEARGEPFDFHEGEGGGEGENPESEEDTQAE